MAYTINRTDGSLLTTIADGTIDNSSSSMTLIGKNSESYGVALNENYVRLLENHSSDTAPTSPQTGQLWFDPANNVLSVYDGTIFKALGAAEASVTEPTTSQIGDTWYDADNKQLHVYDGTEFTLVGPLYTETELKSGTVIETILDDGLAEHVVTIQYVNNEIVSVTSKDTSFIPNDPTIVASFPTIETGVQFAASVSGGTPVLNGDATNALNLGGVLAANYLRSDLADVTTGSLAIYNDAGLLLGSTGAGSNTASISVDAGLGLTIANHSANKDMIFTLNSGAVVLTLDGTTGTARVATPTGGSDLQEIATKGYVDSSIIIVNDTITAVSDAKLSIDGSNAMEGNLAFGVTNQIQADTGTVALPGIAFSGDTDTGIDIPNKKYVDDYVDAVAGAINPVTLYADNAETIPAGGTDDYIQIQFSQFVHAIEFSFRDVPITNSHLRLYPFDSSLYAGSVSQMVNMSTTNIVSHTRINRAAGYSYIPLTAALETGNISGNIRFVQTSDKEWIVSGTVSSAANTHIISGAFYTHDHWNNINLNITSGTFGSGGTMRVRVTK